MLRLLFVIGRAFALLVASAVLLSAACSSEDEPNDPLPTSTRVPPTFAPMPTGTSWPVPTVVATPTPVPPATPTLAPASTATPASRLEPFGLPFAADTRLGAVVGASPNRTIDWLSSLRAGSYSANDQPSNDPVVAN